MVTVHLQQVQTSANRSHIRDLFRTADLLSWWRESRARGLTCSFVAPSRATTPVILGITMHSLLPASCSTCCCRRMPGQALGPTRLGQAPWDLALDPAPMEPPRHTLVKDKVHTCASFAAC